MDVFKIINGIAAAGIVASVSMYGITAYSENIMDKGRVKQNKSDVAALTETLGINQEQNLKILTSGLPADSFTRTSNQLDKMPKIKSVLITDKIAKAIADCRQRLGMDAAYSCSSKATEAIMHNIK